MKTLNCICGKRIKVQSGILGLTKRFPQIVYICECGMAYIPKNFGGIIFDKQFQKDRTTPEILTPDEYQEYKREELKVARGVNLTTEEAIIEISANQPPKN
jgi:hypothetical protein